jgi:glyoxylase-like metal-dependent hydrolase (beta-lactamase superfamily II)
MTSESGDPYTGEVTPGGPVDVRDLGCLAVTKIAVDPETANNCYLLRCATTGEQVLIDAAADAPRLLEQIGGAGLRTIVTTHQHWDHHRALAEVVAATGADVVAGAPDADPITEQTGVAVTRRLEHGDRVAVGACDLRVIALAGHTPGSIALLLHDPADGSLRSSVQPRPRGERADGSLRSRVRCDPRPHLFTGDSLFPGGVGATFGDADAFARLIDEVETKVFGTLPDETWFYPGHGPDSTLGAERPHLPEWRKRGW